MFCLDNHIGLYGVDGQNLFEAYDSDEIECNPGSVFRDKFSNDKKRRIVIYGKGPIAQSIIEQNKDFNIVGIMNFRCFISDFLNSSD